MRNSPGDDRPMDRQQLFDRTVARLHTIVTSEFDAYSALESSGLVRKLLLDDDPLLHQVNRQRRKRVRFEVASNPADEREIFSDNPIYWAPAGALSPRLTIMPTPVIESLSLDQFPSRRAMYVRGHDISVKDVVKQLEPPGRTGRPVSWRAGSQALVRYCPSGNIGFPGGQRQNRSQGWA